MSFLREMKKRFKYLPLISLAAVSLLLSSGAMPLQAQGRHESRWSISSSLTYPIVRIYTLHFNYSISDSHEFFFGPCFQNYRHDSFEANAYTLVLGYRNFLWPRFFWETEIYPAFNRFYSTIDESYYPGVELWTEFKVGYRIRLFDEKFYVQPAPGLGFGIFRTNQPPNFGDEIRSPIFIPQLQIGFRI